MSTTSFKVLYENPLHSLNQICKNTPQFLQIHAQSITNPIFSLVSSSPGRLFYALTLLPNPLPSSSYISLLFSQIPAPNTFLFNTLIRLHSKSPDPRLLIQSLVQMKRNGVRTDNYTYPFVLKACGSVPRVIHGEILKLGFDSDLFVANGLISSYCRSGDVTAAREVFDLSLRRDLVSWNSMMSGYVSCGELASARRLFDEMPQRDAFSFATLIDGYVKIEGDVDRARELFDLSRDKDLVCWNSMIDGYARVGDMHSARQLFDAMPERNVVSWSIVIDGYVRHGNAKEALELFYKMLRQGMKLDRVCAVGAITACSQLGALDQGQWIHSYLNRKRILLDVVVKTSLIDMYMKCGSLGIARRLFEEMHKKSVVSWNVMIVGLGTNGRGAEALELFYRMEKEGVFIDELTFLAILSACTHGGLVDEGLCIFNRMRSDFGVQPRVEHYGCLVDMLGRAGRLEKARELIDEMPMEPTPALWGSLLAACRTHGNVKLAERVVDELVRIGADDGGVYVLMSNVYADEGMWEGTMRMRRLMRERRMRKQIGRSEIELDGIVHEFVNGDCSHCCKDEIYALVWCLSNEMACIR